MPSLRRKRFRLTGTRLGESVIRFAKDDSGSTAIEYALIASMTGITGIGAVTALSDAITGGLSDLIANSFPTT